MIKSLHRQKVSEGASGIEPETSRSAVECSTTELYPQQLLLRALCFKQTECIHRKQVCLLTQKRALKKHGTNCWTTKTITLNLLSFINPSLILSHQYLEVALLLESKVVNE